MHWKDVLAMISLLAGILCCTLIPEQSDFLFIITSVCLAFVGFSILISRGQKLNSLAPWVALGLLLRVLMVFIFPNLSDDIFRFIWDGALWHHGVHPFAWTPANYVAEHGSLAPFADLFPKLNSPSYYSIYPPVCQGIFYLITLVDGIEYYWISVFLKLCIFIAEIISLIYLLKILRHFRLPDFYALAYFLNPLIIIELTGNVHFEVFMLCFLVLMIYALCVDRYLIAGLFFALSVAVKLLPLMFVPLLFFYLVGKGRAFWLFVLSAALSLMVLFVPMFIDHYLNIWQSIDLYFQRFEFNASVYYLGRAIGYLFKGYNVIAFLGPMLSILAMFAIVFIGLRTYKKRVSLLHLINLFNVSFLVYLSFATTVHPWYLAVPLLFNVFSRWKFIWLWSLLIFLSYSAYQTEPVEEITCLVFFEYLLVLLAYILERKTIQQGLRHV